MVSRRALARLILVGGALTGFEAIAAPARPSAQRTSPSRGSRQERLLRELYPHDDVLLWDGSERARLRRSVALALLAREQRLDPTIRLDVEGWHQEPLSESMVLSSRNDRALSRAWIGYLARRRGQAELADATPVARAMPVLEEAATTSELALVATELAIVEALGGWSPVGARLEPQLEPVALETPELDADGQPPRRKVVADRAQLVRRLVQSLDLQASYLGTEPPDAVVARALRRFQRRHGLAPDGLGGPRTIAALNEPVGLQLAKVRVNVARGADQLPRSGLRRYVEVNIPAFELRLVDNGTVTLQSRVIVGDDKTPTPVFDDVIRYIDLDPSWYVPPSITKEVLDRSAREPGYLERAGFVWRTLAGGRPQLIQRPGPENALGRFKFVFPNHHGVYLHDTAQRGLFGRPDQALSHGCVRVERPEELARVLLSEQGWDAARLDQSLATRRTRRIELAEPVPIFLDYRTADIDADGRLRLLPDLYGHDRAARTSFAGKRSLGAFQADSGTRVDPLGEVATNALGTRLD